MIVLWWLWLLLFCLFDQVLWLLLLWLLLFCLFDQAQVNVRLRSDAMGAGEAAGLLQCCV